jgi:hypothetical protein
LLEFTIYLKFLEYRYTNLFNLYIGKMINDHRKISVDLIIL